MRAGAVLLILCVALGACTRPLTRAEADFASRLFGDSLDTGQVGVAIGLGITPPPGAAEFTFAPLKVPPDPCARNAPARRKQPPAAFVAFDRLHYTSRFYTGDAMAGWPDRVRMPHALLLAHELTHVWQWQNRHITGYHPLRAVAEAARRTDPYFYGVEGAPDFFDFGHEQQAALVQDYVCHRFLDPGAPRMGELRSILAPVFPVEQLDSLGR